MDIRVLPGQYYDAEAPVSVVAGLREDCADDVRKAAVRERLKDASNSDAGPPATPKYAQSARVNRRHAASARQVRDSRLVML